MSLLVRFFVSHIHTHSPDGLLVRLFVNHIHAHSPGESGPCIHTHSPCEFPFKSSAHSHHRPHASATTFLPAARASSAFLICSASPPVSLLLSYTVLVHVLPQVQARPTSSLSSFSNACSILVRMAGNTFCVSCMACFYAAVRPTFPRRHAFRTRLLPQRVLFVLVALAGLELLDALGLLHELLVVARFLLDQACDRAGCDGELGGGRHVDGCTVLEL